MLQVHLSEKQLYTKAEFVSGFGGYIYFYLYISSDNFTITMVNTPVLNTAVPSTLAMLLHLHAYQNII